MYPVQTLLLACIQCNHQMRVLATWNSCILHILHYYYHNANQKFPLYLMTTTRDMIKASRRTRRSRKNPGKPIKAEFRNLADLELGKPCPLTAELEMRRKLPCEAMRCHDIIIAMPNCQCHFHHVVCFVSLESLPLFLSRPQAKTTARDSRIPFVGTKSPCTATIFTHYYYPRVWDGRREAS